MPVRAEFTVTGVKDPAAVEQAIASQARQAVTPESPSATLDLAWVEPSPKTHRTRRGMMLDRDFSRF